MYSGTTTDWNGTIRIPMMPKKKTSRPGNRNLANPYPAREETTRLLTAAVDAIRALLSR